MTLLAYSSLYKGKHTLKLFYHQEIVMSLETRRQQHYRAAASSISLGVLIGIIVVIVLAILFVHLANEVVENEFYQFDLTVAQHVRNAGSPLLDIPMTIITNFGSPYLVALAILSLIIGGITVWQSRRHEKAGIVVALIDMFAPTFTLGGALVLMEVVKLIVNRARPCIMLAPQQICPFPAPLVGESGPSFPSGHVIGTVAFYGMCAFLLARPAKPWLKALLIVLATAIVGLIAYSRVYLDVHYATDTLGSILLGSAWLLSVIIAVQMTENHLKGAHTLRLAEVEQNQRQSPPRTQFAQNVAPPMPIGENVTTANEQPTDGGQ